MIYLKSLLIFITLLSLAGCAPFENKTLRIQNLAKSEIDMITDQHIRAINQLSRELTIKLYKRNPRELAKAAPGTTVEQRLQQLLSYPRPIRHAETNHLYAADAIPLAFDDNYHGDRVFALMVAITGMIHASYHYRDEFFMFDEIDHQKLYNCARNLEKLVWHLHNRRTPQGELYILSDSIDEGVVNLSYERIFGKMIAIQDNMAEIIASSSDRTINRVVQGAASTLFLPI